MSEVSPKPIQIVSHGFVLETRESDEAGQMSYDVMTEVGAIRLDKTTPEVTNGDDLDDAPFNLNGSIYSGEKIDLLKGDYVIVIRGMIATSYEIIHRTIGSEVEREWFED